MKKNLAFVTFAISFFVMMTGTVLADSRQLLGNFRDWEAYVLKTDAGETQCYIISIPKTKTPTSLNHGNVHVMVAHKPTRQIKNEFSFIAGYSFRKNSGVKMAIDKSKRFDLFTDADSAWGYDPNQDNSMVTAMKRGNSLVLSATSGRGNATSYRFSLSGFTAAHNAITKSCR